MRRTLSLAVIGLVALSTSGCVRFGGKPPERLLGISSAARVAAGTPVATATQSALFVELPGVPKAIATQRVAVKADATSFAYVKDALWVDTPARQFQALLSETIAAKSNRLVLDPAQYPAAPGQILHGELTEFGVDASQMEAVVTFDASLLGLDGATMNRQRFSARVPVRNIKSDSVAGPINEAANQVAAAVAEWIAKP